LAERDDARKSIAGKIGYLDQCSPAPRWQTDLSDIVALAPQGHRSKQSSDCASGRLGGECWSSHHDTYGLGFTPAHSAPPSPKCS